MNRRLLRLIVVPLTLLISACQGRSQPTAFVDAFPALTFSSPVLLTTAGDGSHRLFVVEQTGKIRVFLNDSATTTAGTFLDISGKLSSPDNEEGLLGLAFDPAFVSNGYFYVNYTAPNPLRTVIARYHVPAATPDKADPLSGFVIMEIPQPYTNHNGGNVAFGPDGYLYVGMGDGGSGNDPENRAQDLTQLLGKFLRIDVTDTTATTHYRIPADNPFVHDSAGHRAEIWAYGMRNPWRWSFDKHTGLLWCGDVGQDTREEVDIITRGGNYGWKIMEGMICRPGGGGNCDTTGLIKPLVDYTHDYGIAVTGGFVYHGYRRPDLTGGYMYADYGSGRLWMLRMNGATVSVDTQLIQAPFMISSFGQDDDEELYIVEYGSSASIHRFAGNARPVSAVEAAVTLPAAMRLEQNYPNPFNPETEIQYTIHDRQSTSLKIYDLLGREVAKLVDGEKEAGTHVVSFSGAGMSSGAYLYRLQTAAGVLVRKMMLVR
jgi:glucose/arabinose dehydrogenase